MVKRRKQVKFDRKRLPARSSPNYSSLINQLVPLLKEALSDSLPKNQDPKQAANEQTWLQWLWEEAKELGPTLLEMAPALLALL